MAVTLTAAAELATAIRVGDTPEEQAEVDRLLATSTALVLRHAPDAPSAIQNEATVRVAGYLFDMPQAGRGAGYADVLRNSGALALLLPWRVHRAGAVERDDNGEDDDMTPTPVALPGVLAGETQIVSVGSSPAVVALLGVARVVVRNRGPAPIFVAVAVSTPGDGVRVEVGGATTAQVDADAGTQLWLWSTGTSEASVTAVL